MADNNTGPIVVEFRITGRSKNNTEDVQWFADQITQDKNGRRLFGLELGDQITFFDERLNKMMSFEGYYKFKRRTFLREAESRGVDLLWQ